MSVFSPEILGYNYDKKNQAHKLIMKVSELQRGYMHHLSKPARPKSEP